MKSFMFVTLVVFAVSTGHAEFGYMGGLIDIPVATPPEDNFISIIPSGSFALGDDPYPATMDVTLSFSIAKKGEITFSALTLGDYSLNGKLSFLEERETTPALAAGIDYVTYNQWISSVGNGNTIGFEDDVGYGAERPKEAFSLFLVATKNIENLGVPFSATVGIGRGKFVGRGPTSKYTNSDIFFDTTHSVVFGVFAGVALKFTPNFSAIMEYDGRDGNLGLRYELNTFACNLALTHLEQLGSNGNIKPRIAFGIALKSTILKPAKKGFITGKVFDAYSKEPIDASIVFSDTKLEALLFQGDYRIALVPGAYRLMVTSEGYIGKRFRVNVRPDDEVILDIPLLNITNNDSLKLHLRMGESFMNEGKVRLARNEFTRALEIYPEHSAAKKHLNELDEKITEFIANHKKSAIDHVHEGWIEEAILEWKEVLKLDPNDQDAIDSIKALQTELEEMKKPSPQVETEEKPKVPVEKKQPEPPRLSAEEIETMYDQALLHYFNEEYERALKMFRRILQADPSHTKAKKYLERTKRILGL